MDDNGFIFVGDSGNNRVQIFNPDGTFLKVSAFSLVFNFVTLMFCRLSAPGVRVRVNSRVWKGSQYRQPATFWSVIVKIIVFKYFNFFLIDVDCFCLGVPGHLKFEWLLIKTRSFKTEQYHSTIDFIHENSRM